MSSKILFLIYLLFVEDILCITDICSLNRECYNVEKYCDSTDCNLICNGTQSCLGLSYKCNSTAATLSSCIISCIGYESCKNINIYSIATQSIINCLDWPSCTNANIICDALESSTCLLNCNSIFSCKSLTCNKCNLNCNSNEPYSCPNITNYNNNQTESVDQVNSTIYNIIFAIFFFLTFLFIAYSIVINLEFFQKTQIVDCIFSLLPMLLFLSFYEFIMCASQSSVLFWNILTSIHVIITISHTLIWYLYLIYFNPKHAYVSSLNYLNYISQKISPKYPRATYLSPIIILFIWWFILLIITYSVNTNTFLIFIIILEIFIFGICMCSYKLLSISINFLSIKYYLTKHENKTMQILIFLSICLSIMFLSIFIMMLSILNNYSKSAHIMRIFECIFEIIFIILSAKVFIYIAPNPELHKMHRLSFHRHHHHGDAHEDDNKESYGDCGGIYDARNVLNTNTFVYVDNNLGQITKLSENECFIKIEESEEIIEMDMASNNIRLAIFGIDPSCIEMVEYDNKYSLHTIPTILIKIRNKLFQLNGHLVGGIFRKEANQKQYEKIKFLMQQNRFDQIQFENDNDNGNDIHILSNLIKDFYHSIPKQFKALQKINFTQTITEHNVEQFCINNKNNVIIWLFNLCADISNYQSQNTMSIHSLSIVFAPNLYFESDPMEFIKIQQNISKFIQIAIQYVQNKKTLQ